jgi:replication factor A1
MVTVKEIAGRGPVDEVTVKISEVTEARDVKGGMLKVADAVGNDDTGSVTITLWNDDIGKVKQGDTIKITKGWANEFQGKIQVSAGKFGEITVVESAPEGEASKPKEPAAEVDAAMDDDII